MPTASASSLLRRRRLSCVLSSSPFLGGRSSSSQRISSTRQAIQTLHHRNDFMLFSSLAHKHKDSVIGSGGSGFDVQPGKTSFLPSTHSRNLPPRVCPPARLRSELESMFDAPIGTLIRYSKPDHSKPDQHALKSAEEEMVDAYYASDAVVQRVEYMMRGLNACVSEYSFAARSLVNGHMALDILSDDSDVNYDNESEEFLARDDCFRAMLDLLERMGKEAEAYEQLRARVRSQIAQPPTASESVAKGTDGHSDDSNESDEEVRFDKNEDKYFDEWAESMEQSMSKAGFPNPRSASHSFDDEDGNKKADVSEEICQFGASPGVTTHMYDLALDALACLCQEQYGLGGVSSSSSAVDLAELMPTDTLSPPALAKEFLDTILNRHMMDGGDIGLGSIGSEAPINVIARGVGTGAGTGAGSLAYTSPLYSNYDVRTCPTPMTFNAVIRVAANFDPVAHAEAVENARVLSGDIGNSSVKKTGDSADLSRQEQERLRDITIDAAMSTYIRMKDCVALTLRTLRGSTRKATSRGALKRQAKLLFGYEEGNNLITGRNSATYAYVIRTLVNCIPPSMSRGNMTFALYHSGCVQEGVMDEHVVKAMRGVSGYSGDSGHDETLDGGVQPPPVSNGLLFDSFAQKELGGGILAALAKGKRLGQDRNHKLRRHVEWDDTY